MSETTYQVSDFRYIDSHVHFFPERLFQAIWGYWERVIMKLYPSWINKYQWLNAKLLDFLEQHKVERFTTLNYAHKKGIAEGLNEWTNKFCQEHPAAIPFGTAHPDDTNLLEYSQKALNEYKFKGLKFQLSVTDFYIHDSRLKPLYKLMQDLDKILVVHTGTAPSPTQKARPGFKVGFKHFKKYFNEFMDNKIIVPHLGGYEYEAFFKIVENHPNVFLDTTMIFIDPAVHIFSPLDNPIHFVGETRLLSFMEEYSNQILHGSDFPNIPYDYDNSIKGLLDLGLSKRAYENIFYENAKKLFEL